MGGEGWMRSAEAGGNEGGAFLAIRQKRFSRVITRERTK